MLLRAYRLTDKFGIALIKSSIALGDTTQAGVHLLVAFLRRYLLGTVLVAVSVPLAILRRLWLVLRRILGVFAGIGMFFVRLFLRVTGQAATSAGGAMARRAARAQIDAGLVEDPLRVQNRVLSTVAVVLLVAL